MVLQTVLQRSGWVGSDGGVTGCTEPVFLQGQVLSFSLSHLQTGPVQEPTDKLWMSNFPWPLVRAGQRTTWWGRPSSCSSCLSSPGLGGSGLPSRQSLLVGLAHGGLVVTHRFYTL